MHKHWVIGLAIAASMAAGPAMAAGTPFSFDTVDAVEILDGTASTGQVIKITGIQTGQSAPGTFQFSFGTKVDAATRCERMASIAMAKPGKFRFLIHGIVNFNPEVGCKLVAVTP